MADAAKDGGQAFPHGDYHEVDGMTLRDYFAGQALAGLMSHGPHPSLESMPPDELVAVTVGAAYEMADAMLATRATT